MSEVIQHQGVIESVAGNKVRVRILQASACSACSARNGCMAADNKEKIIEVSADAVEKQLPLEKGVRVLVAISQSMGWKAVLWAYILPFVLLMAVLSVLDMTGVKEAVAGVSAICAVGVYYIVLGFFKKRLQKQFSFVIKADNQF